MLPAFLDERLMESILTNPEDNLKYRKSQIELYFSVHTDSDERAEYLRSAYPEETVERQAGNSRVGYRKQENGLLMWEGFYPSRTSESVFSWAAVAEIVAQLMKDEKYHLNTDAKPLTTPEMQQVTLFEAEEPETAIEQAQIPIFGSSLQYPQQVVDEALCMGANDAHSRMVICAYFQKDKPDNATFLRDHYGENGAGFFLNGRQYAIWYNAEGFRISAGDSTRNGVSMLLTWEDAAKRIRELLELGRYLPREELEQAADFERKTLAQGLWYLRQDFSEAAREAGYLPTVNGVYGGQGGFPAQSESIELLLQQPDSLQSIIDEMAQFMEAYREEPSLLRFRYHQPSELLQSLSDLQREPLSFPAGEDRAPINAAISMDEMDKLLRGAERGRDYRLGVYSFLIQHRDAKEREQYMKRLHGEYSGYSGGNDNIEYTTKGLMFSHGSITQPYAKVQWNWAKAVKRIDLLIRQGRFLYEGDQEELEQRQQPEEETEPETAEPTELVEEAEPATPEPEEPVNEPQEIEIEPPEPTDEPQAEDTQTAPPVLAPPPKLRRQSVRFAPLHPEIPPDQRHNFRIIDRELGNGTPAEKYRANVEAIRTLQKIEGEARLATRSEQEILSRYVGWGGLADCFDERNSHYGELKSLLDEQEYAAARESTLTAFYTAPVIIEAVYKALSQMGFANGNLLEPSCGVGNFIGMLPERMADSKVYGVELDSISGRIAQQLYQNSSIAVSGFERVEMPDSFFDVALGNVPFGDFKVLDRRYEKHHWLIHDYFFGKTLDKVRPGGVVAFITSKGTMDKENSAVRRYLAQRADLIGAIRLPDNAFKRNAGTEVTSDIIFLQKRDRITDIEPDWVGLDTDENGIRINRYFVQHPEMILGNMVMESTRFGMDTACKAYEDADLSELLSEAVSNLHAEITAYEVEELDEEEDRSIPADPTVRNFSFTTVDGTIYFRENARMRPVEASVTAQNRIRGMIALRDCVRQVIELQTEDAPDEAIQREQARLNTLYDDYTGKYGLLSSRGNNLAFSDDSSYSLLCSLEVLDEEGHFQRKADLFTKRTIRPHVPVTSVDTASEALAVSISEKAGVDMAYMSQLSGKTEAELEQELSGVIFRDIHCEEQPEQIPEAYRDLSRFPFVTADAFLSGNVRRKLRMVRAMAEAFPELSDTLQVSISALEGVQPVDLTAGEIGVRIGVNWVPSEIYEQFMYELFGTGYYAKSRIHILRSSVTGEWNITNKTHDSSNVRTFTTYGTKRVNAYQILELTLNQKDVRVFDTKIEPDGKETRVLNKKETAIAQDRQEIIKAKFAEWLWKDIDRRERLCRVYNETFNSIRPREYDGRHITFPGMNPEIQLRPHQINAIAHVMYGGNTLLAHEVGAGKTFEMVAAAMESKRLGLCTKSLVVVPNHITEQWAAEWLQLYPSANILVATKRDFERKNRRRFCARIATGDYDAIIIGHSQFEKIPMSKERQEQIIQRQIDEIMDGIEQAQKARAERYTIKQLEKTRKSLQQRLDKLNDQSRKDDVVTFEELGVDRLFVDESHYFKNMFLATKMRNVGGIAQTEAQKSSDLFMKCQYLDELTGGRGVVFATGTPISNSMVELYTIQRYLQYRTLEEMDMLHFDDWAAAFGETISAIELSPEGSGYRAKTRFAKFYNLPELMSIFKQCADIQTADMLKLPVPKVNFHTEVIKPSEMQRDMVDSLAERAERIRAGGIDPKVDNMLRITNDGRKLALDMRLVQPLAPDDENGKISRCARNIFRIWEETKAQRGAQLFFCDLSTPRHDGTFNVYDDLKQKLMGMGIPEEEIAYIHDANTEVRKQELFAKVRSGQVRVLMGSTAKMGAGTNVQDRLVALHDADCPWRPSDLAQRLGRIVRQGNKNAEVDVFRYVTENTFDAYLFVRHEVA